MIHPENVRRVLLTLKIVGQELAWRAKGNDWFAETLSDEAGRHVWRIGCNGKEPATIEFPTSDLLMSLDDFSAKHIKPLVPRFQA